MPWDCKECNTHVESDTVLKCPQCGTDKGEWTLAGGRTRLFRVGADKRFAALFDATGRAARSQAEGWGTAARLDTAERAVAVTKAQAREWFTSQQLPPAERVLVVRCWTSAASAEVSLSVDWAAKEVETLPAHTWSAAGKDAGKTCYDARYLFVYGEGAVDDLAFDGLKVIDVTDGASKTGHAPRVGVAALGLKKRLALPLDRWDKGWAQRLQCQELEFNHDSHLLLPDGLAVLHVVLLHAKANPDRRLLIAGHTDATGTVERNDALARDRCANIHHMLTGDRDAWAASALASYEHLLEADEKKAQKDVAFVEEWVGKYGDSTGFEGFMKRYDREHGTSTTKVTLDAALGWKDVTSWKAVYDYYERALLDLVKAPILPADVRMKAQAMTGYDRSTYLTRERKKLEQARVDELKALRAALRWVEPGPTSVGCGEHFLKVKTGAKSYTNRRDEFLFFSQDRLPWTTAPADEAEARALLYGSGGEGWDYQNNDGPWTFDALDCPGQPEIEVPPGNILFVIDVSQSMEAVDPVEEKKPVKRPRYEVCKDRLIKTLLAVPSDRKVGILKFATDTKAWYPGLYRLTRPVRQSAYEWVEALEPEQRDAGYTNTSKALEQALTTFAELDSVVLLSDGLPTRGTTNENTILTLVRTKWNATEPRKRIDTYGFLEGQTLADDVTRPLIEAAYVEALKKTPIVSDRDALLRGVADELKADGVKQPTGAPRAGQTYTAGEVQKVVLGWFLKQLAAENGEHPFKDLNTLTD